MVTKIDVGFWGYGDTADGRIYVQSEDFKHDVRLYVDGNFEDHEQKLRYAESIAFMLNDYVLSRIDLTELAENNVPKKTSDIVKKGHKQYKHHLETSDDL